MAESGNVSKDPNQDVTKLGEKVINYCLQKFAMIHKEFVHSPLFTEEIGDAVVILQVLHRNFLRDRFFSGFGKIVGVMDTNQGYQALLQLFNLEIDPFLANQSIHRIFLNYLALLTELIIFMETADIPVRMDWFIQLWTFIYDTKIKQRFQGCWDELKEEAKKVCSEFPEKEEFFKELKYVEHPYAAIDPMLSMYSQFDPFFMASITGCGFEFPNIAGLASETVKALW